MKTRIFKALSILLAVMVVFSACACIFGTVSADDAEYEVSSTGTYKTIDEVIIAANTAGKVAGDVVTAKIADNDAVLMSATSDFNTEHAFTLVITSENGAKLKTDDGTNKRNIILGGPTIIDNVEIDASAKSFRANGKDFKLGHGVTFTNAHNNIACIRTGGSADDITVTEVSNIEVGVRPVRELQLTNDGAGKLTYEKDVNIVYDDTAATPSEQTVRLGMAGNGDVTFNGNINLNVKSGHVKFNSADTAYINGNIQVINSASMTIKAHCVWQSTSTEFERWDLTNITPEYNDVLGFIEGVTGKYSVAEGYVATAIDKNGAKYVSAGGVLDLTTAGKGEYNVKIEVKQPTTYNYYVGRGATPNNEPTYDTIADVIAAANNNPDVTEKDLVVANILGTETIQYSNDPTALLSADYNHSYTLKITAENAGAMVNIAANVADQGLMGDTIFDNVTITNMKPNDLAGRFFHLNGHSVTFNENVTIYPINQEIFAGARCDVSGDITVNEEQTIIFNNLRTNDSYLHLCAEYGTATYKENINVIYNHPDSDPRLALNSPKYGHYAVYEKDINIILNGAILTSFHNDADVQVGGALRVITEDELNAESKPVFEAVKAVHGVYTIINKTGVSGSVKYTDTAGKIAVDVPEGYTAVIDGPDGAVEFGTDGCFTLGNEGVYTVKTKAPSTFNYYVGSGATPNNEPIYDTIADVIAAANSNDEISSIDTVVVNVLGNDTIQYSNDPSALLSADYNHSYTLKIIGEYPSVMVNIAADVADQGLMGDTIFDNVTITNMRPGDFGQRGFHLNGHSATFNSNVTIYPINQVIMTGARGNITVDKEQTIIFNNLRTNDSYLSLCSEYGTATYNESINVIYNHPDSDPRLAFNSTQYGHYSAFRKDVNIIMNGAVFTSFENPGDVQIGGALRLITEDELNAESKPVFDAVKAIGGVYTIYNKTNMSGVVKYTNTAGKIKVDVPDFFKVKINGPDGDFESAADKTFELGKAGVYKVTVEDSSAGSRKMLYFKLAGGAHYLSTRVINAIRAGESYVFEYSIVCNLQNDSKPSVHDGELDYSANLAGGTGVTSYTTTKVGDYYRVVAQVTIPEGYTKNKAFFGIEMAPFSEGYIFDRTVYRADDASKTDLLEGGNYDFSKGLDYMKLDANSSGGEWFGVWSSATLGLYSWENGAQKLEIVPYSEATIKAFLKSLNPEDGKWWNDEDVVEEEEAVTYASAKGTFKDSNGKGINNTKMLLVSEEKEYVALTNANGEFDFGKILTGFYELYVLNGSEKIFTGFSQYIAADDVVTFNVVSDVSNLAPDYEEVEEVEDEEEVEEIVPSGNLTGTVYTPYLETVANLKLYLEGVGEVTTDENGNFAFGDVPVGKYKLYTILEDESEYKFRDVEINENVDLKVKLKFDPPKESFTDTDPGSNGWIVWVIVASVIALVVVAGLIFFLVFKKKKA